MKSIKKFAVGVVLMVGLSCVVSFAAAVDEKTIDNSLAALPQGTTEKVNYGRPFEPPTRPAFIVLPPGVVEPAGWLRDWCLAAREGYTGHLADMDQAFRQAWAADYKMTGEHLNWEKGGWPYEGGGYWFEGMARLGYVLHDDFLINQAKSRLGDVVNNMNENGIQFYWWLNQNNPEELKAVLGKDMREPEWPIYAGGLLGRALTTYYAGSKDPQVLKALEMAYAGDPEWITMGWSLTNPWPAFDTYTWTGNKKIADALTALLESKAGHRNRYFMMPAGNDPSDHGVHFLETSTPWLLGYLWTGKSEYLQAVLKWHEQVEKGSMQPHGVPVFDEFYGPTGAFRGTETCDVSGYIWSKIRLLEVTGKACMADRVEQAFFNAGPAVVERNFKSHVYFQSPNRMAEKSLPDSIRFNYQPVHAPLCCTAALNRFLPNYVQHMWMATYDNGLAAVHYGPCKVSALVADKMPVELTCNTEYPFNETIEISVKPDRQATFPLWFRIPGWCKNSSLTVNQKVIKTSPDANGFVRIERLWKPGDKIRLEFPMSVCVVTGYDKNPYPKLIYSPHDMPGDDLAPYASVHYGPLLFALSIADTENANTPDPAAKWNYALAAQSGDITVERGPMPAKWDWPLASPLKLHAHAVSFDWQPSMDQPLPLEPVSNSEKTDKITLIPYGCTKFRVSMFPVTERTWRLCGPPK